MQSTSQLTDEQQNVIDKYLMGENIFMTGSAGCGKTFIIKTIWNQSSIEGKKVQVCALTGCASMLLECKASTIHSWSGIGLGNGTPDAIVKKIRNSPYYRSNWMTTKVLIVDEVSMMSQKMFDLLDFIGKTILRNSRPFGGIQLIFSGDFFQLSPVCQDNDDLAGQNFCFESENWFETFPVNNHVILTQIFRQTDDNYRTILNQLREGKIKRSSHDFLMNFVDRELPENKDIKPTKLFPRKNQVNNINTIEMEKLTGDIVEYEMQYVYDIPMSEKQKVLRLQYTQEQINTEFMYLRGNMRCDPVLSLKIGCQVMCIVNINLDSAMPLCNGSQGIVVGFNEKDHPIVKFHNGGFERPMCPYVWPSENIPGIGISQIPLVLAWALTIHKSQGASLDYAEIDAGSGIFVCGQTYVALSRVRTIEGLYLSAFDVSKIKVNKKVQDFYDNLKRVQLTHNVPTNARTSRQMITKSEDEHKDEDINNINNDLKPASLPLPLPTPIKLPPAKSSNIKVIRISP